MDESIVSVSVESMRPDIAEARGTPNKIKNALVYMDEDELDTGMQKVQPLPFLDEEIERFKTQIRDSVPGAKAVQDDIPAQVLGKVDHVIKVAKEGETTLFKASELLEFTSDAFLYARKASQNKSDLKRESVSSLKRYDETFRKMIESRINAKMEEASDQQEECFRYLERAVREAEADCKDQRDWVNEEVSDMQEDSLKEVHENVEETIRDEQAELGMIRDQCNQDISAIDKGVQEMHQIVNKADGDYNTFEVQCTQQLESNRREQADLQRRLRQLRQEEEKFVTQINSGRKLKKDAETARGDAVEEMDDWKRRIEELHRRTETSLQVMDEMKDCTDMIMDDAKKWKKARQECLDRQELASLLILRDCLMAHGTLYKMVLSDCENNADARRKEVADVEKAKKQAARTGFNEKVRELKARLDEYNTQMGAYESKIKDTEEHLETIARKLREVDEKLRARKDSSIRLDGMEDRYKRRKKLIDDAYEKDKTEGIPFTSLVNYKPPQDAVI